MVHGRMSDGVASVPGGQVLGAPPICGTELRAQEIDQNRTTAVLVSPGCNTTRMDLVPRSW
jgi:hypothetical protein